MRLPLSLKSGVKRKAPLAGLTTFRIGGPAEILFSPAGRKELSLLLAFLKKSKMPFRVIGKGSNILAADEGLKGALVKLEKGPFRSLSVEGDRVRAGAGVFLPVFLRKCAAEGLSGAEFLAGVPGTVGGALVMNCGVSDGKGTVSIGDIVDSVEVTGTGGSFTVKPRKTLGFGYRSSSLSRSVVVSACFRLARSDPREVRKKMAYWLERRKGQDYRFPSAGCVFRNPGGVPAGKLIDDCGLKGRRAGGARISERHANFIVNTGSATCADVLSLMRLVRREVIKRHGIRLYPEIRIWK